MIPAATARPCLHEHFKGVIMQYRIYNRLNGNGRLGSHTYIWLLLDYGSTQSTHQVHKGVVDCGLFVRDPRDPSTRGSWIVDFP